METCIVCHSPDDALTQPGQTCAFCKERMAVMPDYPEKLQHCRQLESDLNYMMDSYESFPSPELRQAVHEKYDELMAYSLKLVYAK